MNQKEPFAYGTLLVYLASCALNGTAPKEQHIAGVDLDRLFSFSKFQSMQSIAKLALDAYQKNGGTFPEECQAPLLKFQLAYEKTLKRLVGFSFEREALFGLFEELQMPYLPLKGIILSRYYPRLGMRQMTDNDILIPPLYAKDIRNFMRRRGYTVVSFGTGCHDMYQKGILTFEIHRSLFPDNQNDGEALRFCEEAIARAKEKAGKDLWLTFSPDDLYIYTLLHTYKHYEDAGTGIRSLMDLYVLRHRSGHYFHRDYIEAHLRRLGILSFALAFENLADTLFGAPVDTLHQVIANLTKEQEELFLLLIASGTFGTDVQHVSKRLTALAGEKKVSRFTKLKYAFTRLFPPYRIYRERYPRASKWIVTIPFLWLARTLGAIFSPKTTLRELEAITEAKKEQSPPKKDNKQH